MNDLVPPPEADGDDAEKTMFLRSSSNLVCRRATLPRPVLRHVAVLVVSAAALVTGCASSRAGASNNFRLTDLYAQDQSDRRTAGDADWSVVERRDAERRREVAQMLERGMVRTAADHYHAAMIFQHGSDSTAYRLAHDLAREAERLGSEEARWLSAATLDRYLLSIGEPQRYGTQFTVRDDVWYLSPMDTTAVTDDERRRAGTRTLAEIRAYLAQQNGTATASLAPPPERHAEHAPTVELVGGLEGLIEQIEYPAEARAAGVEGRVRVQLVVLADGTVGEAFVVDGLGHGLDEEAIRVVRQARFTNHIGEPWEIRLAIPFSP